MGVVGTPRAAASVVALHCYPVKSMLGERVGNLTLDKRGVVADRTWAVRTLEGKIGSGKNTRRFAAVAGLQQVRARLGEEGVLVTLPDGSSHRGDSVVLQERLSRLVGEPVTLVPESDVTHFDDGPVSLIARASVEAVAQFRGEHVDESRFRPNIVVDQVDGFDEESWLGRRLCIGSAVLSVDMPSPRCVMIDQATADLPPQHGNLLAVGRLNNARLGVIAHVVQPGIVRLGDSIHIE